MRRPTRQHARFLASLAVVALALAPALAEARPGGGSSSGSRGARTHQAPPPTRTAPEAPQRFDRTQTAPSQPTAPSAAPARPGAPATAGAAAAATRGNWFQRNPFLAGFLGAGLFGMLLGGGLFSGLSGLAGVLGLLLQVALIALLVMFAVRLFRRRQQPAMAGGAPMGARMGAMMRERMDEPARASGLGSAGLARGNTRPTDEVGVSGEDFAAFEALLVRVNDAWSRRDIATLQRIATPEMAQYFRDDYAALDARGWRNETRDVKLDQGDLAEAWEEGARRYATVAMRFSLIDVTRDAEGRVVEGDAERRQEAKELWTFVRVPSGPWTLSAIQQVGA